jgi:hypothetical protein
VYSAPHSASPTPGQALYVPAAPVRRYPALRFLASGYIWSAWVTLIISIAVGGGLMLGAGFSAATTTAGNTYPGGTSAGTSGGEGGPAAMGALLQLIVPGLKFATGVFTIATGLVTFLLLLAIGEIIFVLLDTEENTRAGAQAMTAVARRMGLSA